MSELDSAEVEFVHKAIRREALFFRLSMLGVFIGLIVLLMSLLRGFSGEAWASTFVVSILVLLNARQNLRQAKYARVLGKVVPKSVEPEAGDDG
jgi:hypothetical protein